MFDKIRIPFRKNTTPNLPGLSIRGQHKEIRLPWTTNSLCNHHLSKAFNQNLLGSREPGDREGRHVRLRRSECKSSQPLTRALHAVGVPPPLFSDCGRFRWAAGRISPCSAAPKTSKRFASSCPKVLKRKAASLHRAKQNPRLKGGSFGRGGGGLLLRTCPMSGCTCASGSSWAECLAGAAGAPPPELLLGLP